MIDGHDMEARDRIIAVTGAEGRMSTALRPDMRTRYGHVVLHSRQPIPDLANNETNVVGDLSDLDSVLAAFEKADSVLHLGGIADEVDHADLLHSNIVGTLNAYEAARLSSVRRFVYASSHHAVGFYPASEVLTERHLPRPDSFYGVSKVYGEALGRLYVDKFHMQVVCLRIGSFRPLPETSRQLRTWLSPRDGV